MPFFLYEEPSVNISREDEITDKNDLQLILLSTDQIHQMTKLKGFIKIKHIYNVEVVHEPSSYGCF